MPGIRSFDGTLIILQRIETKAKMICVLSSKFVKLAMMARFLIEILA
jgi:hypothetical protein